MIQRLAHTDLIADNRVCTSCSFFRLGLAFLEGEMAEPGLKKFGEVQTWILTTEDLVQHANQSCALHIFRIFFLEFRNPPKNNTVSLSWKGCFYDSKSAWDSIIFILKILILAPFSQPVHTLCPPVPKMDENFFGKPYGSPTPKNTIKIDFWPFRRLLGALFQKNLKLAFFKIWIFRTHYLSSRKS